MHKKRCTMTSAVDTSLASDLDSLAGAIAYSHCLPLQPPSSSSTDSSPSTSNSTPEGTTAKSIMRESHRAGLYVATAAADRLDLFRGVEPGEVQYVQVSSRERSAYGAEVMIDGMGVQGYTVLGVYNVCGEEFDGGCGEDGGDGEGRQYPNNAHAR